MDFIQFQLNRFQQQTITIAFRRQEFIVKDLIFAYSLQHFHFFKTIYYLILLNILFMFLLFSITLVLIMDLKFLIKFCKFICFQI